VRAGDGSVDVGILKNDHSVYESVCMSVCMRECVP
jgi:hypothetical protein